MPTKIILNGQEIDASAVYIANTNYLAVRQLLELFGVPSEAIKWDGSKRIITVDDTLTTEYMAKSDCKLKINLLSQTGEEVYFNA